jgi:hypothetical protein
MAQRSEQKNRHDRIVHSQEAPSLKSMMMTTTTVARTSIPLLMAVVAASALIVPACTGKAVLYGLSCPCTDGYFCCESDGMCLMTGEECSATTPEKNGSSSGGGMESSGSSGSTPAADDLRIAIAKDQSPRCLIQDSDHLYWQNADGKVAGIAKNDGSVVRSQLATPAQPVGACGLVIDGGSIYATMYGLGSIAKISLDKTTTGTITLGSQGSLFGALLTPSSLAIDATYIYVTELDSGAIKRLSKTQAAGDAGAPAAATVLGNAGAKPHDIIVEGEFLYWLDEGGLRKMSREGGHIITLSDTRGAKSLSRVDGQLYWNDEKDIWTMSLPAGAPRKLPLLAKGATTAGTDYPSAYIGQLGLLAADTKSVFFLGHGAVARVPLSGGDVEMLFFYREPHPPSTATTPTATASNATFAKVFTLDAYNFYWVDETTVWSRRR